MSQNSNKGEKAKLHKRNKNRDRYDLQAMTEANPELRTYIQKNKAGVKTINFSDPKAVKILNTAILNFYYGITYWDFPNENLCPPIPGRAEYIHNVADLLSESNYGKAPSVENIRCLDVGTGASCIYPILGITEYNWHFIASDIDPKSIASAQKIVDQNTQLKGKIECRLQRNPKAIFRGILLKSEKVDLVLCNPPFHSSLEEATKGTRRKIKNLTGKKMISPKLNFSGNSNELVYEGGEFQFISNMVTESKDFAKACLWFTCLVSKESNIKKIYTILQPTYPSEIKTIPIKIGNKSSRIIAWTYFTSKDRKLWLNCK